MNILRLPAPLRWSMDQRARDVAAQALGWVPAGDRLARVLPDATHDVVVEYLHRALTRYLSGASLLRECPEDWTLLLALDDEDAVGPVSLCSNWSAWQAMALLGRPNDLELADVVDRLWSEMNEHLIALLVAKANNHNAPPAAHASAEVAA